MNLFTIATAVVADLPEDIKTVEQMVDSIKKDPNLKAKVTDALKGAASLIADVVPFVQAL